MVKFLWHLLIPFLKERNERVQLYCTERIFYKLSLIDSTSNIYMYMGLVPWAISSDYHRIFQPKVKERNVLMSMQLKLKSTIKIEQYIHVCGTHTLDTQQRSSSHLLS